MRHFPSLPMARASLVAAAVVLLRAQAYALPPPTASVGLVTVLEGNSASAQERLEALHRLTPGISRTDAQALLAFATLPNPAGFPPVFWHALVNDTFDLLLKMKIPPDGLEQALIGSAADHPDPVLRDYALQKLETMLRRRPLPSMLQEAAMAALAKAAGAAGQNFQGTALLTWQRMEAGKTSPEFRKAVVACLQAPSATAPARTAALQAGGTARLPEAAEAARLALRDPKAVIPLRLSALATLGAAGMRQDAALIESLLPDPVCGPAARSALARLVP